MACTDDGLELVEFTDTRTGFRADIGRPLDAVALPFCLGVYRYALLFPVGGRGVREVITDLVLNS
jgi:hypothetical protein